MALFSTGIRTLCRAKNNAALTTFGLPFQFTSIKKSGALASSIQNFPYNYDEKPSGRTNSITVSSLFLPAVEFFDTISTNTSYFLMGGPSIVLSIPLRWGYRPPWKGFEGLTTLFDGLFQTKKYSYGK